MQNIEFGCNICIPKSKKIIISFNTKIKLIRLLIIIIIYIYIYLIHYSHFSVTMRKSYFLPKPYFPQTHKVFLQKKMQKNQVPPKSQN